MAIVLQLCSWISEKAFDRVWHDGLLYKLGQQSAWGITQLPKMDPELPD